MLPGILAAVILYFCLYRWRRSRLAKQDLKSGASREGVLLLFWMFCGGMAVLTLTPWGFHWITFLRYGMLSDQGSFFSLGDINLIPFNSVEVWNIYTAVAFLGNIIMFMPFGFFLALLWRGFTRKRMTATGLCITGLIECWQLLVGRAFDIDDLILNTVGVLCGWWLWYVLGGRGFYCRRIKREN